MLGHEDADPTLDVLGRRRGMRTKKWSNFGGSGVSEPRRRPSDGDAVVTRCAAGAERVISERAGNNRVLCQNSALLK